MIDLQGKRVTIAGKLAGKYAGKSVKMLGHDLQRLLGAELLPDFDSSADVAILGAKSKGFRKRIDKAGMATVMETELQHTLDELVAAAKAGRSPKKTRPPSRYQLFEHFAQIRHRPRDERRAAASTRSSRAPATFSTRAVCRPSTAGRPTTASTPWPRSPPRCTRSSRSTTTSSGERTSQSPRRAVTLGPRGTRRWGKQANSSTS